MKRLLVLLSALFFLAGCVSAPPLAPPPDDLKKLDARITKLEQQIRIAMAGGAGAAFRPARALTGTGGVDAITTPADKDVAFAVLENDATYGNAVFIYVFNASGSKSSDELPYIIQPDDATSGDWELAGATSAPPVYLTSARAITPSECRSGVVFLTTTDTATLPAAATAGYGTTVCIIARDAEVATVDLDNAEKFFIAGAAKAAGVTITSDGAAGDYWCGVAVTDVGDGSTDGWWTLGMGATAWQ